MRSVDGPIDAAIAPLVWAMRRVGLETLSSCEGHFDAGAVKHIRPNVIFRAPDRRVVHALVRALSQKPLSLSEALPVDLSLGPVWDEIRDEIREDTWVLALDASWCDTPEEAARRRDRTVAYLLAAFAQL